MFYRQIFYLEFRFGPNDMCVIALNRDGQHATGNSNGQPRPPVKRTVDSCWINADNETDAEIAALQAIESEGWKPDEVKDLRPVDRAEYLETEALEYFDSALKDGACFVFHTYPPE